MHNNETPITRLQILHLRMWSTAAASNVSLRCDSGHALELSTHAYGGSQGWICDCCQGRGSNGERRLFCQHCHFDVCLKCKERGTNALRGSRIFRCEGCQSMVLASTMMSGGRCPECGDSRLDMVPRGTRTQQSGQAKGQGQGQSHNYMYDDSGRVNLCHTLSA